MTRYAYMRVSSSNQDHDSQRAMIEKRYAIDKWVTDTGTGRIMQPNLLRLARAVKQGDEVVVYAFDRLGRSTSKVISVVQKFKEKGVPVLSLREGVDLNSPAGNMIFQMMCSIAEFESELISERIKSGLQAAVAKGVKLGPPRRIDDPEQQKTLELARKYREQGLSYRKVCDVINEDHGLFLCYGTMYKYLRQMGV